MDAELPLQGLYLYLLRSGFPISVRDYQDALVALRRGYGSPSRADLHWLCSTLWARTDQEVMRLDRLFREFPYPSPGDVEAVLDRPATPVPARTRAAARAAARRATAARSPQPGAPAVEFAAPTESGVGLPAAVTPQRGAEVFVFTPRPLLPLRALIVAWRRFRLAQRSGPPVELDLNATIAELARCGRVLAPVMLPARRNQARLLVLVDLAPGMATWRHMTRLFAESLATSQMAQTAMYFFDAAPESELYAHETLSRPVDLQQIQREHAGASLIIVSDAGAGTATHDRERVAQVRRFTDGVKETWPSIAWLNPMPRARWKGTSAADIARLPALTMFPFTDDGLIQAVDLLRGKRD